MNKLEIVKTLFENWSLRKKIQSWIAFYIVNIFSF